MYQNSRIRTLQRRLVIPVFGVTFLVSTPDIKAEDMYELEGYDGRWIQVYGQHTTEVTEDEKFLHDLDRASSAESDLDDLWLNIDSIKTEGSYQSYSYLIPIPYFHPEEVTQQSDCSGDRYRKLRSVVIGHADNAYNNPLWQSPTYSGDVWDNNFLPSVAHREFCKRYGRKG